MLVTTVKKGTNGAASVTLERLRILETLYENGYRNEIVDRTVEKLLNHEIQKDEVQLAAMQAELVDFEARFALPSEEFEAKYQRGEMGDDAEVFEWHTLFSMTRRLETNLSLLKHPSASA